MASDRLDFDTTTKKAIELIKKDINPSLGLYIIVAINSGLRCGDLLKLTFEDLSTDTLLQKEQKTSKIRAITINDNIKEVLNTYFKDSKGYCFKSQKGIYTIQSINRLLKQYLNTKKVKISSHSMRKTFGYRVFVNNNESEKSLIMLSQIFRHSSTSITRIYLGISKEEIENVYLNL